MQDPHASPREKLVVVIMAGGAGTRFWPLSVPERPKQFVELVGNRSLLQETHARVLQAVPPERILVLTGASFVDLVREQLPDLPRENVVGEPVGRDTGAAVALAAHLARTRFPGSTMAVLPADHVITPVERFVETLEAALTGVEAHDGFYTFGIEPSFPSTGYGYLELGEACGPEGSIPSHHLLRFKEKPDRETAEGFLAAGNFLWNSGMFVWRSETIWSALEEHMPVHASRIGAVDVSREPDPQALLEALDPLEKVSVDFGVMEKVTGIRCVRASFQWSDVGGWLALEGDLEEVGAGNRSRGETHAQSAEDNLVFCQDPEEVVGLVGVRYLVVVRAGKRTLVAHKDRLEELKTLVKQSLHPTS